MRHTFWTLVVGIYFVWLPPYTVDQQMVQRFSSARSLRDAKMLVIVTKSQLVLQREVWIHMRMFDMKTTAIVCTVGSYDFD